MRAVVQRVSRAEVTVGGRPVGACRAGLVVLLGVAVDDTERDADQLALKISRLRIFASAEGKLDLSVVDAGGEALVVSQFTLLAETAKGNRPGFSGAARPDVAEPLYRRFCATLRERGIPVATGVFGAAMQLELVNDGPVTIVLG
jgi:D-tyrosyl-tRNA(Tyr) deacylase